MMRCAAWAAMRMSNAQSWKRRTMGCEGVGWEEMRKNRNKAAM